MTKTLQVLANMAPKATLNPIARTQERVCKSKVTVEIFQMKYTITMV